MYNLEYSYYYFFEIKIITMKKGFLFFIAIFTLSTLLGQNGTSKFSDFRNVKIIDNSQKAVYFLLDKVGGTEQANQLKSDLENDANISSFYITPEKDGKYACKAIINRNITPDYILNFILAVGADFDMGSFILKENPENTKPNEVLKKRSDGMPDHYPYYISTGNPEYDNSIYDQAKQEWIKNYPNEVELMTGRSYQNSTGLKNPNNTKK
jgi:hypothetical protein